ncbi:XRE family transcriptional regulator [Leptospira meyeri]|nr:XRE family transcriptional regulator [Leptospira meyeri]
MDIYAYIAKKIAFLRENFNGGLGISQSELARRINEKPNTISRWETGDYKPRIEDLYNISKFFSVPISIFFPEEKVSLDNEICLLIQNNEILDEKDLLDIKNFINFRIASKKAYSVLKPGRKRRKVLELTVEKFEKELNESLTE